MASLPYLYRIDYRPPESREKKTYRLSLQEASKKFLRHNTFPPFDKHSTSNNANRIDNEKNFALPLPSREMSFCHWYNEENVKHSTCRNTPCTVASPCSLEPVKESYIHPQPKTPEPKLPSWVEAIGLWVPAKRKPHAYETFIKHIKLAYRNRDMFMDPCPYLPRCKHARTLSALDRQKQRIREMEEIRREERFLRLLERFTKIQEHWEHINRKSDVVGAEHQARLNAFKKTLSKYKDPLEDIKKKRIEREKIERELQKHREAARKARIERMRRRIPRIIVTEYRDVADEISSEHESVESTGKEKIPIPSMPSWNDIENQIEESHEELMISDEREAINDTDKRLGAEIEMTAAADNEVQSVKSSELTSDNRVEATENVDDRASLASASLSQLAPPSLSSLNPDDDFSLFDKITSADETDNLMSTMSPMPFGIANGVVLDQAMTASSVLDRYHIPSQGRLNNIRKGRSKNAGTWCPKNNDKKQFLQVDVGSTVTVKQIATQGYATRNNAPPKDQRWVTSYSLAFSEDGVKWTNYTENGVVKTFQGNTDNNTIVMNSLAQPIEARYIRVLPVTWKNGIALRLEIFGNFPEERIVTPVAEAIDAPGSDASGEDIPSIQTPLPSKSNEELTPEPDEQTPEPDVQTPEPDEQTPEPEEPWYMTESISEGLVLGRAEFTVNEEKSVVERESQDIWNIDAMDEIYTAVTYETTELCLRDEEMPLSRLKVLGEQKSSSVKRNPKKPKTEKMVKKEKKKKRKKKKASVTSLPDLDDLMEESEVLSRTQSPEQEVDSEMDEIQEEEPLFVVPPLPQLPEKESTRKIPKQTRKVSIFAANSSIDAINTKKRHLGRATTDDSIRKELRRQKLAEDRRKKFDDYLNEKSNRRSSLAPSMSSLPLQSGSTMEQFIAKFCILSEGQVNYYQRIFDAFDEDEDGLLFPDELLDALEHVNSNLLSDSHLSYIFRILELCDCSLDTGVDFKFFSVILAFSQRIAALDDFAKILIPKLDFKELDFKLLRAKSLFMCCADEETKTMPLEHLTLQLIAGGLTETQMRDVLGTLGQTTHLDFFDFLSYIPLFIHIHDNILNNPLGGIT